MPRSAYLPYAPLQVLKPFAESLWIAEGPEIGFGLFGLKLPFPTRMTVVRLEGGAVWVHSPIQPTDGLVEQVRELGEIRFLIAPNTLHYWWIEAWAQRFPDAGIYAVPGLARKAKRPLPGHSELTEAPPPAWAGEIDQLLVNGDLLNEAVFFHRASRSLILTDLIENFEPWRVRNPLLRALMRMSGAADPDGKAPIDMQLSFRRRAGQLRAAVQRMIEWAPERIVLAHGRCYDTGGVRELRRAFRWIPGRA